MSQPSAARASVAAVTGFPKTYLGRSFDFIRVDLYNIDGEVFFGELTPYPASGIERFKPVSFDSELGAKWELPVL